MNAPPPPRVRLLAISSAGGHWIELRRIMPAFDGLDVCYASVHGDGADDVPGHRYYTFRNFTRFNLLAAFGAAIDIAKIVAQTKPQVVVTTGAAPALLAFVFAKLLFGSKTIWIDSIGNVEKISTSGRIARHFSSVWLTQWPHLARSKGPIHWGSVL